MSINIYINGLSGKMGQAIAQISTQNNCSIAPNLNASDIAIDFSVANATLPFAQEASSLGKPLIIGTTGHSQSDLDSIKVLSTHLPLLISPNFSIGINLLFHITQKAAQTLPSSFEPAITEIHHKHKLDSPSGTALKLASLFPSPPPIQAHRLSEIPSEHTVLLVSPHERLELSHKSTSRHSLAQGTLHAVHWLLDKPPGLYDMLDVLNLK